jgi:hypothetical protein
MSNDEISNKYIDPSNLEDILEQIKTLPTLKEVLELSKSTFPDWIICFLDKFSQDYPHMENNWNTLTSKHNIRKGQIMIINYIIDDDNHRLINIFAEIFTQAGFVVRTKNELFPCEVCNSAIPSLGFYNKMKEQNLNVPENWSKKCSTC